MIKRKKIYKYECAAAITTNRKRLKYVNHVNICQNRLLFEAIIQMTNSLGLFSMKENNTDITAQNRCSTKSTKPDSSGAVSRYYLKPI